MKKSLEFTAAAVAAIMAMSCTSLTALAKTTSGIANDDTGYVDSVTGGWEVTSSYSLGKNPEAKAAFKKSDQGSCGSELQTLGCSRYTSSHGNKLRNSLQINGRITRSRS